MFNYFLLLFLSRCCFHFEQKNNIKPWRSGLPVLEMWIQIAVRPAPARHPDHRRLRLVDSRRRIAEYSSIVTCLLPSFCVVSRLGFLLKLRDSCDLLKISFLSYRFLTIHFHSCLSLPSIHHSSISFSLY